MLFGTDVVGWANAAVVDGALSVQVGFAKPVAARSRFDAALRADVRRLAVTLGVPVGVVTTA